MERDVLNDYLSIVTSFRRYLEMELKKRSPYPRLFQDLKRGTFSSFKEREVKGRREDSFGVLEEEVGQCQKCSLSKSRTNAVFGKGCLSSKLVIIGEAPGYEEDIRGEPFVGRAGELLTKMLAAIEIEREDVYITNVIKCRPPGNRNPLREEIEACLPYLLRQLSILKPSIILSLGNFATQTLLDTSEGITRLRGMVHTYQGVRLIPTFHPAYLLRNPDFKRAAWEDMKLLRKELPQIDEES